MSYSFQSEDSSTATQTTFSFQQGEALSDGNGPIVVEFSDAEMEHIQTIASQRNKGYESAGGKGESNTVYGKGSSSGGVNTRGAKAEKALALLYDEAEVDEAVYENGDDGVDMTMELGGEQRTVDVKATKWGKKGATDDSWLLLKAWKEDEAAEAFVSVYTPAGEDWVQVNGWVTDDELLKEENIEASPAAGANHKNFTIKGEYRSMPKPDTERGTRL